MNVSEFFGLLDWQILLRIVLAVLLGGMVGLEREFSGRAAGFRTHILVCVGSTIIVLASNAVPRVLSPDYAAALRIDPGRIAAGIVTGIGFLGAGAIIRRGDFVRGLTTAACIWFAAALGIVIGQGHYVLAFGSTLLVLAVLRMDVIFETHIRTPIYRILAVRVKAEQAGAFDARARPFLKDHRVRIQDIDYAWEGEGDTVEIVYYVRTRKAFRSPGIVEGLKANPGVLSVRWEN